MKDKEIILFPFDYEQYITNSKSLAFDFDTYTPGVRAYNFDDLLKVITNNTDLTISQREDILKLFWGDDYPQKANNEKLYQTIKQL